MSDFADDLVIDTSTYVFSFGQYKGMDYEDVKLDDPAYILWCIDNMDWFIVSYEEKQRLLELTEDSVSDLEDVNPGYMFEWDEIPY